MNKHFLPLLPLTCAGFILGLTLFGQPTAAHIEDQYNSVHFHSGRPDFGTPPRRAIIRFRGEADDRPFADAYGGMNNAADRTGVELTDEAFDKAEAARYRKQRLLYQSAREFEVGGNWARARWTYQRIALLTGWTGDLRDRIALLNQAASPKFRHTAPFLAALTNYLHGMALDDQKRHDAAERVFNAIVQDRSAGVVAEHSRYQLASLAYERGQLAKAAQGYNALLLTNPETPLRESALIMIARCVLLPDKVAPDGIKAGKDALRQLEPAYRGTRFHRAINGLYGRIAYLEGRYTEALGIYESLGDLPSVEMVRKAMPKQEQGPVRVWLMAAYLTRLANAKDYDVYMRSVSDIDRTRTEFSPADAHEFAHLLMRRMDVAIPYFYYRLYLCDNGSKDVAHLATLADAIAAQRAQQRHGAVFPDSIRVRLAEVYYQQGRYDKAVHWASDAAKRRHPLDRALYVRGAALQHLHRDRRAIADFTALLRRYPNSPLQRGAREELALLWESVGNTGKALEQYFFLDYQADIAFFLDARMTTSEIERYQQLHPHDSHRDLISYSLGIRYLRDEKWYAAERWLRRVPRAKYVRFNKVDMDESFDPGPEPAPLATARALSALRRAVDIAPSRNAHAAALYRYASYYYTHGTLLLYNSALWQDKRSLGFAYWWNTRHATPGDNTAARAHMYQHEVYARAMKICLDIATRYPRAPVAPQALYRAACCARKLSSFNDWWRKEDDRVDLGEQASHLMKRVYLEYPHSPLAVHARKYAWVFNDEEVDSKEWRKPVKN